MTDTRPWDRVFGPHQLQIIRDRRNQPDGMQIPVQQTARGQKVVQTYPWDRMTDGDYFIAEVGPRNPEAMEVAFRQASYRYDMEIHVHRFERDDHQFIRVTRITGHLRCLKLLAQYMGAKVQFPDVERRRRNDAARRVGSDTRYVPGPPPRLVVEDAPDAPPRPTVTLPDPIAGQTPALPEGTHNSIVSKRRKRKEKETRGIEDNEYDPMEED